MSFSGILSSTRTTSFLNGAGKPRPILNQNQYGGTIGGPIKKDKLFFFTSYQQTWQKNGAAGQGLSNPWFFPIPGTSGQIGGDRGTAANQAALAAQLGAQFCTTGPDGGTTKSGGVQVACNGSNINPVALNLLQLKNPDGTYLIPSAPAQKACTIDPKTGVCGTSTPTQIPLSIPASFIEEQYLQNVDYVINSKNTLSAHYFFAHDPLTSPFGCGKGGAIGICYPDTNVNYVSSNHYLNVQLTSIATNNLVNVIKLGAIRSWLSANPTNPFFDSASCPGATASLSVGITPIQCDINYLNAITVASRFTIGSTGSVPGSKYFTNLVASDEVSWTHGKHTLRFGGEYERDVANRISQSLGVGNTTFQTIQDFLLGLPGCSPAQQAAGCTAATPAPGTNGSGTSNISSTGNLPSEVPPGGLIHSFRAPYANLWVQDDIKLTRKFTLNVGVRWEYAPLQADAQGLSTNINPDYIKAVPIPGSTLATGTLAGYVVPSNFPFANFPAPPVGGLIQSSHLGSQYNNTPVDNFAPRVGFAWSPLDSNRLTIRSGIGVFDDRAGALSYYSGISQQMPYATPLFGTGAAIYYASFANPYQLPPSPWTPRYVNFATGITSNLSGTMVSPYYNRTPIVYQWNLAVQYQFLPTWTLELGYVGSRGVHQEGISGIPSITGQTEPNGAYLYGTPAGALAPGIAAGLVSSNLKSNASLRTPFLGFAPGGILEWINNEGTKYNGAQVTLRKQVSHGVTFQASYSWSRSFGTTNGYDDPHTDVYELNPDYHPQRLAINYQWNIPASYEGMLGKVANGWAVSGVTILQTGVPLTITDANGGTIYGFGPGSGQASTAQFCPGMGPANVAATGATKQRLGGWFNTAAFADSSTCGSFIANNQIGDGTGWGNVGRSALLGPGQFNWDISLIKTTKVGGIHEDATLVFRTEFFNAFNHAQFSNPASLDASTGAAFGAITSTSVNPRLIQFALKYIF